MRNESARVEDPAAAKARAAALAEAERAAEAARAHRDRLDTAQVVLRAALLERNAAAAELATYDRTCRAHCEAKAAAAAAGETTRVAAEALAAEQAREAAAERAAEVAIGHWFSPWKVVFPEVGF